MRGGGRGGRPYRRSPSPGRRRTDTTETTTTTPKKEVEEKGAVKKATTGPPTKQQLRQNTRTSSRNVNTRTSPPNRVQIEPLWPTVGVGEVTTDAHIEAVRGAGDANMLAALLGDLVAREPHRTSLIRTVERQIIRIQLYWMMGGNIATRSNIQLDGMPVAATPLRDVKSLRQKDKVLKNGTDRQTAVWNSSRTDAEVDTIRDIRAWASKQSTETLAATEHVVIQLVGTSGPCEACKQRLFVMANEIVDEWNRRTGLPKDSLPAVEIRSYYGNPPKYFERMGYTDVLNGWQGDPTPPDLTFTNQKGAVQHVREHLMGSVNLKPDQPDKSEEEPETSTEEPDRSTEEPGRSTGDPGTSDGGPGTSSTKPEKSEDLLVTSKQ